MVTRRWVLISALVLLAASCLGQEPMAEIAIVSNPYLTTLQPSEIKDENGRVRDFLSKTAPEGMQRTVALVNAMKPDALIVLGSLSWSGSEADFQLVRHYLDQVSVPVWVTHGHRDRPEGSIAAYEHHLKPYRVDQSIQSLGAVSLAFAGDLDRDPDAATSRLEKQLGSLGKPKAVVLFGGMDRSIGRSKLTDDHKAFWKLIDQHRVAALLNPTRYGHQVGLRKTLPMWNVASTGWSARGAVSLLRIYEDRVELSHVKDLQTKAYALTVPNPVNSERIGSAESDPFQCPSHSLDLAKEPRYTFALVSDPQFDREANRAYLIQKAEAAITELNRLAPEKVFVAGDLVNNNLPEEWELFNEIFGKLEPPVHHVPGNHDVLFNYDFVESSYASAPKNKPEYAKIVGRAIAEARGQGFSGPAALYEKYTGSKPQQLIQFNDSAFITIPFLTTRADAQQIDFLKQQLAKTARHRHVFVIAHYPSLDVFGNNVSAQRGGTEVLALLHQYQVTGYLFGHRHRNGFHMHERTAHVLADNMQTIHLFHVFDDHIVVGRKRVGSPLYESLEIPAGMRTIQR